MQAFGRIDTLINCAGIGLYATVTQTRADDLATLLATNATAHWRLSQLVVPIMRDQRQGSIVNIGSVAGDVSLPWAAAYSASKFCLRAMNDSLRRELRGEPIQVVEIRPGIVTTNFRANVLSGKPPKDVGELKRTVSPAKVADAIVSAVQSAKSGVIYVPRIGRLFALMGTLSPVLMDWYLGRMDGKEKASATQAPRGRPADV